MKNIYLLLFGFLLTSPSFAQKNTIERIEPMNWWTDMHDQTLQIMVYGKDIGAYSASTNYPGFKITKTIRVESPNYLFIYAELSEDIAPGSVSISLKNGKKKSSFDYVLKARKKPIGQQGFDASDVIYLMMPDRFANGDTSNDNIKGMLEGTDRSKPNGRHGGDLKGVSDNINYIKDLGMTAIWFTPIFENDMKPEYGAYHGYAATDMYKVDRRFGTNEEFQELIKKVHANDMKVIMDMIHNHIGDQHWWMKDLPSKDWLNDKDIYGTTNYRGSIASDPYKSDADYDKLTKAWFVSEMPDLNQKNELLADYLIQNTIWWIEEFEIDGIRMDTYVYPDKDYMARWAKEVMEAYPTFNIVGEAWVNTVAHEAYWQENFKGAHDNYNSHLPSVTDFQTEYALVNAFNEPFGWKSGLMQIYYTLSQDHVYNDPMKAVIFLDNHDLTRYFNQIGQNKDHFKMGYTMLMTLRGIPQVYYGTELLFGETGDKGDGSKRPDMPGGWKEDSRSIFTAEGRTPSENETYDFVKAITTWRKTRASIHEGKTKHFVPEDNVYVYFRYTDSETTMVIVNLQDKDVEINPTRYKEVLGKFKTGKLVPTNSSLDVSSAFTVKAKTTSIFELN